jgi:predicted RNase H-like HicB family nuclease
MRRLKKHKKKLARAKKKRIVKRMKKIYFASAVWREGKQYVAQCLNVDVASFGSTKAAALKNLKEVLELYLEDVPVSKITRIRNLSLHNIQQFVHI